MPVIIAGKQISCVSRWSNVDCGQAQLDSSKLRSVVMTRKPKTAAGVDELDNADRRRILGIIDQFRELGVNEDISLPQVRNRISGQ